MLIEREGKTYVLVTTYKCSKCKDEQEGVINPHGEFCPCEFKGGDYMTAQPLPMVELTHKRRLIEQGRKSDLIVPTKRIEYPNN